VYVILSESVRPTLENLAGLLDAGDWQGSRAQSEALHDAAVTVLQTAWDRVAAEVEHAADLLRDAELADPVIALTTRVAGLARLNHDAQSRTDLDAAQAELGRVSAVVPPSMSPSLYQAAVDALTVVRNALQVVDQVSQPTDPSLLSSVVGFARDAETTAREAAELVQRGPSEEWDRTLRAAEPHLSRVEGDNRPGDTRPLTLLEAARGLNAALSVTRASVTYVAAQLRVAAQRLDREGPPDLSRLHTLAESLAARSDILNAREVEAAQEVVSLAEADQTRLGDEMRVFRERVQVQDGEDASEVDGVIDTIDILADRTLRLYRIHAEVFSHAARFRDTGMVDDIGRHAVSAYNAARNVVDQEGHRLADRLSVLMTADGRSTEPRVWAMLAGRIVVTAYRTAHRSVRPIAAWLRSLVQNIRQGLAHADESVAAGDQMLDLFAHARHSRWREGLSAVELIDQVGQWRGTRERLGADGEPSVPAYHPPTGLDGVRSADEWLPALWARRLGEPVEGIFEDFRRNRWLDHGEVALVADQGHGVPPVEVLRLARAIHRVPHDLARSAGEAGAGGPADLLASALAVGVDPDVLARAVPDLHSLGPVVQRMASILVQRLRRDVPVPCQPLLTDSSALGFLADRGLRPDVGRDVVIAELPEWLAARWGVRADLVRKAAKHGIDLSALHLLITGLPIEPPGSGHRDIDAVGRLAQRLGVSRDWVLGYLRRHGEVPDAPGIAASLRIDDPARLFALATTLGVAIGSLEELAGGAGLAGLNGESAGGRWSTVRAVAEQIRATPQWWARRVTPRLTDDVVQIAIETGRIPDDLVRLADDWLGPVPVADLARAAARLRVDPRHVAVMLRSAPVGDRRLRGLAMADALVARYPHWRAELREFRVGDHVSRFQIEDHELWDLYHHMRAQGQTLAVFTTDPGWARRELEAFRRDRILAVPAGGPPWRDPPTTTPASPTQDEVPVAGAGLPGAAAVLPAANLDGPPVTHVTGSESLPGPGPGPGPGAVVVSGRAVDAVRSAVDAVRGGWGASGLDAIWNGWLSGSGRLSRTVPGRWGIVCRWRGRRFWRRMAGRGTGRVGMRGCRRGASGGWRRRWTPGGRGCATRRGWSAR